LPSVAGEPESARHLRPRRGLAHGNGPLGGAFLIPRPRAVVGDSTSLNSLSAVTYLPGRAPSDCDPPVDLVTSAPPQLWRFIRPMASTILAVFTFPETPEGLAMSAAYRIFGARFAILSGESPEEVAGQLLRAEDWPDGYYEVEALEPAKDGAGAPRYRRWGYLIKSADGTVKQARHPSA
jgi:hypothetical protein